MSHPRLRRITVALGALSAGALLLSSCASGSPATSPSTGAEGAVRPGGTLTVQGAVFPPCLDPVQFAQAIDAVRETVDTLVAQDNETGELVPWLATSWEVSDDGLTYTFELRDDVTFSDGTAFDAAAVKANLDNVAELGAAGKAVQSWGYVNKYTGADVLGDHRVAVHLSSPSAGFLQALSDRLLGIQSPDSLDRTPEDRCLEGPVGSGPFVISEVVAETSITTVRREGYDWASPLAGHQGEAYLDGFTFQAVAEDSVRNGSLLSGQADVVTGLSDIGIAQVESGGGVIFSGSRAGVVSSIFPNVLNPILADLRVRQALLVGVDRQEIIDTVFNPDYVAIATGVTSRSLPGYVDLSDRLDYDPDHAEELLDAAGWKVGDDGIREKDGTRLALETTAFPANSAVFELVQAQYKKIGVEFTPTYPDNATRLEKLENGNWDFIQTGVARADADALATQYSVTGPLFKDRGLDELGELLLGIVVTTDPAERAEIAAETQELILDQVYSIPLFENSAAVGARSAVHDIVIDIVGFPLFYDAWIDED